MENLPLSATGALLDFGDEVVTAERLANLPGVSATTLGARGWTHLLLSSREPLIGEIELEAEIYRYRFLFRKGRGRRTLILGMKPSLVFLLLQRLGKIDGVQAPGIHVDGLVHDFAKAPGKKYLLGAVVARVEGHGSRLRTLIVYGDDLASTSLFKSLLGSLSPYRATLRKFGGRQEIVSVGSHGEINFQYTDAESLREVDNALSFLSNKGFIDWDQTYRAEVALKH